MKETSTGSPNRKKKTSLYLDATLMIQLKIYCAKNDIKVNEFLSKLISEKINTEAITKIEI